MHVEVNETNIALYSLVQLTGNTKEVLLQSAKEAQESGYTLYCQIPDPDEPIQVNAFEHFDSEPAPKVRDGYNILDGEGNVVVRVDEHGVETVMGEVVDSEED